MDKCSKCSNPRRKSGRYCLAHHAEDTRNRRKGRYVTIGERAKNNVRSVLRINVKRGNIIKTPCEVCGDPKVEGHHDDYLKPLEVRWLCRKHHQEITNKQLLLRRFLKIGRKAIAAD